MATEVLVVGGWFYFIDATAMDAIWPMFEIMNQLLAVMALAIATVAALVRVAAGGYLVDHGSAHVLRGDHHGKLPPSFMLDAAC